MQKNIAKYVAAKLSFLPAEIAIINQLQNILNSHYLFSTLDLMIRQYIKKTIKNLTKSMPGSLFMLCYRFHDFVVTACC